MTVITTKYMVAIGTKSPEGEKRMSRSGFTRIDIARKSRFKLARNVGNTYDILAGGLDIDYIRTRTGVIVSTYMKYIKIYPGKGHWDEDRQTPTAKWREWSRQGMAQVQRSPVISSCPKKSPIGSWHNGKFYIESETRKKIFIPMYYDILGFNPSYRALKDMVNTGEKVLLLETDGPSQEEFPKGLVVTFDNIRERLDSPAHFGYSWVVAAKLTEIDIMGMLIND